MSATYRVIMVDSKISSPSAAIPSPDVGEVVFYPDLWIVELRLGSLVCVLTEHLIVGT